jgi:thiaminase
MDGYINYLYQEGGNNRRYSESIADAAYARYLVNADSAFIVKQLDSMQQMYREWSDHYDSPKTSITFRRCLTQLNTPLHPLMLRGKGRL